jgi:prephenate dehydrogenase
VAAATTLEGAAASCDVIVLAAPPLANLRLLRRLARLAPRGRVITDVGSVKGPICREAERLGLSGFVGGHPMAGNEGRGFAASSARLFRGRSWLLTPRPGQRRGLRAVRRLVRDLGAQPIALTAGEHDRVVAHLSHVPQLVAWALAAAAEKDGVVKRRLALAGPGYRDMTRLSKSPRSLWREILAQNHDEVARALRAFRRALET